MTVQLTERPEGPLPAKTVGLPSQGVAAWAASTHFQTRPTTPWAPTWNSLPVCAAFFKMAAGYGGDPENYGEDDFDNVLNHLNDGKHELMDASELVAEINKLLPGCPELGNVGRAFLFPGLWK